MPTSDLISLFRKVEFYVRYYLVECMFLPHCLVCVSLCLAIIFLCCKLLSCLDTRLFVYFIFYVAGLYKSLVGFIISAVVTSLSPAPVGFLVRHYLVECMFFTLSYLCEYGSVIILLSC